MSGNLFQDLREEFKEDLSEQSKKAVLRALDRLPAAVHEWNAQSRKSCNHAGINECATEAANLRVFILQGTGDDW